MSRIYWDSMLFMYWLEDHPTHAARVEELHEQIRRRSDTLCTSIFSVGEILTGLYKQGAEVAAVTTREMLRPPLVELIPFTAETTEHFSRIRAANRVSPADAIHLASAAQSCVNLFLTNDRRLSKLVVRGIDFIAGLDVNLF
jgi:predicted nucleic acid-binding protein